MRTRESQQAPSNALIAKSTVAGSPDGLGEQKVMSQEVLLCKGVQYDTRWREMPGSRPEAHVSRVDPVPP